MNQFDRAITYFDKGLRTLWAKPQTVRPHPDASLSNLPLSAEAQKHAQGLMRVNHCGEVCAQALYLGQAITAKDPSIKMALEQASKEEEEHLAWTQARIQALGGRTSMFNPLWYVGSLTLGVGAGLLGDRWSLGFLEETERQVCAHLDQHLTQLPAQDQQSRAVVMQMRLDEAKHAHHAHTLGAHPLPWPVKTTMRTTAKIMTKLSYFY